MNLNRNHLYELNAVKNVIEGSTRFSPENVLLLFTQSFDLTLKTQKEKIFKEIDKIIGAKEVESFTPVKKTI